MSGKCLLSASQHSRDHHTARCSQHEGSGLSASSSAITNTIVEPPPTRPYLTFLLSQSIPCPHTYHEHAGLRIKFPTHEYWRDIFKPQQLPVLLSDSHELWPDHIPLLTVISGSWIAQGRHGGNYPLASLFLPSWFWLNHSSFQVALDHWPHFPLLDFGVLAFGSLNLAFRGLFVIAFAGGDRQL